MTKQKKENKILAWMKKIPVNRKYKDTVFRMIFKEPKELLGLYNALNGTNYKDISDLKITTLENAVYMNVKNDVSCLLDMRLQLYEHQSTVNPNMPLRYLGYGSDMYELLIAEQDIYSGKQIRIPTPRFIVFYNGVDPQPERREMKLSEAFEIPEEYPALELIVIQLNINDGFNEELKAKCPTLMEYMLYVDRVREYRQSMPLDEAVQRAVDECIEEGILREFLLKNKREAMHMSIYEYDEERHRKTLRREGYEEGYEEGREEGECKKLISLVSKKLSKGKSPDVIADELEEDIETIQRICDIAQELAPGYDVEKIFRKYKER